MQPRIRIVAALVLLAVAACGSSGGDSATRDTARDSTTTTVEPVIDPGDHGDYHPTIDPADFVDVIDNPYLPMPSGARWVYDGGGEHTEVVVTGERRAVMGVSTWVVHDTVSKGGEIIEDTRDYFAQDRSGNVWYFGEDSREFEDGIAVNADGSWEGGIDGALPGIILPAKPEVGHAYRQEFDKGNAEDMAEVLEVDVARSIGLGSYDDVVVTKEWNPLEPDVTEEKWYARGVGPIHSGDTAGGTDSEELVSVTGV